VAPAGAPELTAARVTACDLTSSQTSKPGTVRSPMRDLAFMRHLNSRAPSFRPLHDVTGWMSQCVTGSRGSALVIDVTPPARL